MHVNVQRKMVPANSARLVLDAYWSSLFTDVTPAWTSSRRCWLTLCKKQLQHKIESVRFGKEVLQQLVLFFSSCFRTVNTASAFVEQVLHNSATYFSMTV